MASQLRQVVEQIADAVRAVEGIRSVPNSPPDSASAFPFVVVYPANGVNLWNTAEDLRSLHDIKIDLHLARRDLAFDTKTAIDFAEAIPNAIAYAFKNGDMPAATTIGDFDYTFSNLSYAGVETIGFSWTLNAVKILSNLTAPTNAETV